MGANSSSQRQKRRGSQSGQHYPASSSRSRRRRHSAGAGSTHSAGSSAGGGGGVRPPSHGGHHYKQRSRHQQRYYTINSQHSRASSYTSLNNNNHDYNKMASTSSSSRRNAKSASTRTLLDKKCVFLGRYFARQFSQPVLQRLRYHVQRAKGTKTRLRLSTKGLTIGSKNNNLFKQQKAPYEFLPMDDIHEIFVDNDLRNVLLVIKGLPDGHLELLTYKLTDELEARLYQQTFNEMVAMSGSRASQQHYMQRVMESAPVDTATLRSSSAGPRSIEAQYTSGTMNSGSYNRRAGNSWGRGSGLNEGYVYRLKGDDFGSAPGTPASRRGKPRHRSEGDALDAELRRQQEDREFMAAMRERDVNDNLHDEPDGPIRLIFNRDGEILETHGTASIIGDGKDSYISDHDSGIQSKDTGHPDIVDSGLGTVRAQCSGDYTGTTRSSASHSHHTLQHESLDHTDGSSYRGNGFVTSGGRASRSPTRPASSTGGHITHHVRRTESPAPSNHSRTQSEGGWRLRMPWKRRSRSSDSHMGGQVWETTSLMVGSHSRPMGTMHLPRSNETPPEYIVMYPTLNKGHRTKSKSASRFEL